MSKNGELISPGVYSKICKGAVVYNVIWKSAHVGQFDTLEDAKAAAQNARDEYRIAHGFKTDEQYALEKAEREAKRKQEAKKRKEVQYCMKYCVYADAKGVCTYSEFNERSRLAIYYDRTGATTPEGLTHGADCTEFEPRKKRKLK